MPFKRFEAWLKETNKKFPLFHGLDATNNITNEELFEILLHVVPNEWGKKSFVSWIQHQTIECYLVDDKQEFLNILK